MPRPVEYFEELPPDRQRSVMDNIYRMFLRPAGGRRSIAEWCTQDCLNRIITAKVQLKKGPSPLKPKPWYYKSVQEALLKYASGMRVAVLAAYYKEVLGRLELGQTHLDAAEDPRPNAEDELIARFESSVHVDFLGELRIQLASDADVTHLLDVLVSEAKLGFSMLFDGEQQISNIRLLEMLNKDDPEWTIGDVANALRRLRGKASTLREEYAARGIVVLDKRNSDDDAA